MRTRTNGTAAASAAAGLLLSVAVVAVEPPARSPLMDPAVASCNAFGIDLYQMLASEQAGANLFLSPYSMSIALTMTAEGARGETAVEMARVLHFPLVQTGKTQSIGDVHAAYASLTARLAAAAGKTDDNARKQAQTLRRELDAANAKAERLQGEGKWSEAGAAAQLAEEKAADLNRLLTMVDRYDLRIANALWVERAYPLSADYVRTIDGAYGTGGVTPLDISGQAEKSRSRINAWVEEKTQERIKDLIPKGALTPDTRLVITNAVYFKGQWAEPFEETSTREEDFSRADGKKVLARMMNDDWRAATPYAAFDSAGEFFDTPRQVPADESLRPRTYPDDGGFTMIALPYKGGELSMVLIAPRTPDGLPALEARLSAADLDSWLARLDARTVHTAVPRFTVESANDMSRVLVQLGMERAFTDPALPSGAEFPGMVASEDPAHQLFIGGVLHKAWIEVNEKGTEAAAATAVMMRATAARPQEPELIPFVPVFRADRPFMFLIRDSASGAVLFIGRVVEPRAV